MNLFVRSELMAVTLDFAYCNDRLFHISEELNRSSIYTCPFCKEMVHFRKGEVKEHHFYHKPNSNCSATAETVLHFNAKHYLQAECEGPSGYNIFFEFLITEHSQNAAALSKVIKLDDKYKTNLHDILVFYRAIHGAFLENTVGPYVVDVYVETEDKKGFVIEVCVTHEMGGEKREYFEKNLIPYLEVIPEPKEDGMMEFFLKNYYLPDFFKGYDQEIEDHLVMLFYEKYQDKVIEEARKPLIETDILNYKIKAVKALTKTINNTNLLKDIKEKYNQSTKSRLVKAYNSEVRRTEPLHDIQYITSSNGRKFLMGNEKKYFISSEQNLLYEIVNLFSNEYNVNALIGGWNDTAKEGIIGFEFSIPNSHQTEKTIKEVLTEVLKRFELQFKSKIKNQLENN